VDTEDDEIFPARARVFLAAAANLLDAPDGAFPHELEGAQQERRAAHLVGNLHLDAGAANGLHHAVGVGEIRRKGLLHVDVGAGGGSGLQHGDALVEMARADADEVWFFFGEHFAVVAVAALCAGADEGFRQARFVRVGDGNGLDKVEGLPDGVESRGRSCRRPVWPMTAAR
jgi:hypothetical protein